MNKNQREKHKQSVKEFQEKKRLYNKEHFEEIQERRQEQELQKKDRLDRKEKRILKKIKKKKIQRLRALRKKQLITVEEYQKRFKELAG